MHGSVSATSCCKYPCDDADINFKAYGVSNPLLTSSLAVQLTGFMSMHNKEPRLLMQKLTIIEFFTLVRENQLQPANPYLPPIKVCKFLKVCLQLDSLH